MPLWAILMIVQVVLSAASAVLLNNMGKKTQRGEFKAPTVDAGPPVPVWFGTALVAPNTVWWGNTNAVKHLQWFYLMSAHLVLGWGIINEIIDIRFGNKSCRNKPVGGIAYICVLGHTGHAPPNATYWTALDTGTPSTWWGAWDVTRAYVAGDSVAYGSALDYVLAGAQVNAGAPLDITINGNQNARNAGKADAMFGGDAAQGGIGRDPATDGAENKGQLRLYWGTDGQPIDPVLAAPVAYGANCSAWPQLAYIRMGNTGAGGVGIGTPFYLAAGSGVPQPMTVLARRTAWWEGALTGTLSPLGQSAAAATIRYDASVPEILYALLTHPGYGLGRDPATIDIPSFAACAAALLAEPITATKTGFGLSVHVGDAAPAEQTIAKILSHVGAVLATSPVTQKVTLKLIRGDYDVSTLPHINPSNSTAMRYAPGTWTKTFNEIRITYQHFENTAQYRGFAPDVVTDQDLANFQATRQIRSQTIDLPYVTDPDIAALCCARTRRATSVPLPQLSWKMNRQGYALASGDVVVVDWPAFGIEGLVVRLLSANRGSLDNGELTFNAVEDVFAATHSTFPAGGDTAPSLPPPAAPGGTDTSGGGSTPPGVGAATWGTHF